MFHKSNNTSSDLNLPLLPQPYCFTPVTANEFNGVVTANFYYNLSPTSQSPPSNYSSSLPSSSSSSSSSSFSSDHYLFMTSSALPLQTHHISEPNPHIPFFSSSSPSPSPSDHHLTCDFSSQPVRRVFSTGDLQRINSMQASVENVGQERNAPAAARVGRSSAEERKERIERYRSKRNNRNFQKKITYACRKTLADSRPRVRGRFAKNDEIEVEADHATEESSACYEAGSYTTYTASYDQYTFIKDFNEAHQQQQETMNYINNFAYSNIGSGSGGGDGSNNNGTMDEWCRQMQAALAAEMEEDECRKWAVDEDTWANYLDVLSMNLLS